MPTDLAAILRRLAPPHWSGYQDVVDLVMHEPARITELVRTAIRDLPRSVPAIDTVLGLVPDADLQGIADQCVAALRAG